jgi:glycopeptide antibiotics resistance protein
MKEAIVDVFNNFWPTTTIFIFIISLIRILYLRNDNKKFILYKELLSLIFITYLLLLFQLVTYKEINCDSFNLMPFKEIFRYSVNSQGFYKQVLGNILLFIPLGYFISYYVRNIRIGTVFISSVLISVVIEGVQHFIGRCFDIDDIILNVVGGTLGFLIFISLNAIKNHLPSIFQKDYFYNLICIILIIIIVLYLLGIRWI